MELHIKGLPCLSCMLDVRISKCISFLFSDKNSFLGDFEDVAKEDQVGWAI